MNHHSREVDIEELPQLASGGVNDDLASLIEAETIGEDPEPDDDPGASVEGNFVV